MELTARPRLSPANTTETEKGYAETHLSSVATLAITNRHGDSARE